MNDRRTRLTRAQILEVIEQAARMTELDDRMSVDELKEIAAELDLDPLAVEAALQNVLSEQEAAVPRRRRAGLLDVPDAERLREIRPAVFVTFLAASAMITPGDSVVLSALLGSAMVTLYEAGIALRSVLQSRGPDDPSGGSSTPLAARILSRSRRVRSDPDEHEGRVDRITTAIVSMKDGVRAFQSAVRGI